MLLEIFNRDPGQDVDLEYLVEEGDPGLHGEVVEQPRVDLEEGGHVKLGLLGG